MQAQREASPAELRGLIEKAGNAALYAGVKLYLGGYSRVGVLNAENSKVGVISHTGGFREGDYDIAFGRLQRRTMPNAWTGYHIVSEGDDVSGHAVDISMGRKRSVSSHTAALTELLNALHYEGNGDTEKAVSKRPITSPEALEVTKALEEMVTNNFPHND